MAISIEEVERIAKLSKLEFNQEEKEKLQHELAAILDYVGQIQTLQDKDETNLAPAPDEINLVREDIVESSVNPEEFLSQAPSVQGKFIKVKSILE